MSEPSSPDSLPERQLPDWKTVVWNAANEIDLAASSRHHFIAMEPR
jgi:hypothetical protein